MFILFQHRVALAAFVLISAASPAAWAVPTYEYVFDQTNYSVAPGGTVVVNVSLRETLGVGDTSLLNTEGLLGAGLLVRFDVPAIPSDRAEVLASADFDPQVGFDGPILKNLVPASSAGFTAAINITSPAVPATGGPTTFETLLGSFTFTAGLVPGEVTNLLATDWDTGTDDTITNLTLTILDGQIDDGAATITVQGSLPVAVPEPASIALWLMFAAASLIAIRRRTR